MASKKMFFVGLVALMAVAIALHAWNSREESQSGVVVSTYVYSAGRPLDYQVHQADSIAMVTVENVGQAQWSVKGITSPVSVQEAIRRGESPSIFRPVTLRVETYLKYPQEESVLTVYQTGGELDGVTVEGFQQLGFQKGMRVVIFLERQRYPSPIDWGFSWAYVLKGDTAYNVWDGASLSASELLLAITNGGSSDS